MDKSILGQELLDAATDLSTAVEPAPLALLILHADECQVLNKLAPGISSEDLQLLQQQICNPDKSDSESSSPVSQSEDYSSMRFHLKQRITKRKGEIRKTIEKMHLSSNKQRNNKLEALAEQIEPFFNLAAALVIAETELTTTTAPYQPALEAKSKRISQVLLCAIEKANNKETKDALLLFDTLVLMLTDWTDDLEYKQSLFTDLFSLAEVLFTSKPSIADIAIAKPSQPDALYRTFTEFYQVRKNLCKRFSKGEQIQPLCEESKTLFTTLFNVGFASASTLAGQLATVNFTVCLSGSLAQGTAGPKSDLEYFVIYENSHDQGHLSDRCSRSFLTLTCRIFEWFFNTIFGFSSKEADVCMDVSMNPARNKRWIATPRKLIQKSISKQLSAKGNSPIMYWTLLWSTPAYSYGDTELYEYFNKEWVSQLTAKGEDAPLCSILALKYLALRSCPLTQIETEIADISADNRRSTYLLGKRYYDITLLFLHATGLNYGFRSNSIFSTLTKLNQEQILTDDITLRLEELLLNLCREKWTRHCKPSPAPVVSAPNPNERRKDLETLHIVFKIIEELPESPTNEKINLGDRIVQAFSK